MMNSIKTLSLAIAGTFLMFPLSATAFTFVDEINGADLVGLEVTVKYVDGTTERDIWEATSSDSGEARRSDWFLSKDGDTDFRFVWTFGYTGNGAISSLFINALPANAVFDSIFYPGLTPGTGFGTSVGSSSGVPPTSFTYSGSIPNTLDDVRTSLELVWENGFTQSDAPLVFQADIDGILGFNPDPDPDPDPVTTPEPTAILGVLALLSLGAWGVKKKQ
ncbi:MAG: PEP-CTERM sorting domain-containing protein [Cyanobacteria bacterium SBLK]|nr:PEP-CTERM sorting domain-containing protein [Cyanobacteria bacterium SBLK]